MTLSVHESQAEAMQLRFCRGMELQAALGHYIEWISSEEARVPSSTGFGKYRVSIAEGEETCQCPDFAINQVRGRHVLCKHIIGLQIHASAQVKYYVEKRHDSLLQDEIYIVMQIKDGRETVVDWSKSCAEAHTIKWQMETEGRVA